MEEQLNVLGTLLPDLIAKLPQMKASLLLALVKDTQVQPCHICLLRDCGAAQPPYLQECGQLCKSWQEIGQRVGRVRLRQTLTL